MDRKSVPRQSTYVYNINDDLMVMVATDPFGLDVVLPREFPSRSGAEPNWPRCSTGTSDICPNWKLATPDPMVTVGLKCGGFRVEMIIRGILTGSAWRGDTKAGCAKLCGVKVARGNGENGASPSPSSPDDQGRRGGHDMNISRKEIIRQGLVSEEDYAVMEDLRAVSSPVVGRSPPSGLILVDTKYEFGSATARSISLTDPYPRLRPLLLCRRLRDLPRASFSANPRVCPPVAHRAQLTNEPGQTLPRSLDAYAESVSESYIELRASRASLTRLPRRVMTRAAKCSQFLATQKVSSSRRFHRPAYEQEKINPYRHWCIVELTKQDIVRHQARAAQRINASRGFTTRPQRAERRKST